MSGKWRVGSSVSKFGIRVWFVKDWCGRPVQAGSHSSMSFDLINRPDFNWQVSYPLGNQGRKTR